MTHDRSPLGGPALDYASAGVDLAAADRAVDLIRDAVASTATPGVLSDLRGFAGVFALPSAGGARQVLVASTDGVGTKAMVAAALGRYDTIGVDLVASLVDDVVTTGAAPLFVLDYLAVGRLDPEMAAAVVEGIAGACRRIGVALLGGEMAEHPGSLPPGQFDLAGTAIGLADADRLLGAARVREGDVLVGIGSDGLRCNGYSLARRALLDRARRHLDEAAWPGASLSLGDALIWPSRIYAPAVVEVVRAGGIHAAAHITGGGLPGNLSRVLPAGLDARVVLGRLPMPEIFAEVRRAGSIAAEEMARVFNLGVGYVLVVEPEAVVATLRSLEERGETAAVIGEVVPGDQAVRLEGLGQLFGREGRVRGESCMR